MECRTWTHDLTHTPNENTHMHTFLLRRLFLLISTFFPSIGMNDRLSPDQAFCSPIHLFPSIQVDYVTNTIFPSMQTQCWIPPLPKRWWWCAHLKATQSSNMWPQVSTLHNECEWMDTRQIDEILLLEQNVLCCVWLGMKATVEIRLLTICFKRFSTICPLLRWMDEIFFTSSKHIDCLSLFILHL